MVTLSSTITFRQMKTIEIKGSFRTELGKKVQKNSENQEMYHVLSMGKKRIFTFMLMRTALKTLCIHPTHIS